MCVCVSICLCVCISVSLRCKNVCENVCVCAYVWLCVSVLCVAVWREVRAEAKPSLRLGMEAVFLTHCPQLC